MATAYVFDLLYLVQAERRKKMNRKIATAGVYGASEEVLPGAAGGGVDTFVDIRRRRGGAVRSTPMNSHGHRPAWPKWGRYVHPLELAPTEAAGRCSMPPTPRQNGEGPQCAQCAIRSAGRDSGPPDVGRLRGRTAGRRQSGALFCVAEAAAPPPACRGLPAEQEEIVVEHIVLRVRSGLSSGSRNRGIDEGRD